MPGSTSDKAGQHNSLIGLSEPAVTEFCRAVRSFGSSLAFLRRSALRSTWSRGGKEFEKAGFVLDRTNTFYLALLNASPKLPDACSSATQGATKVLVKLISNELVAIECEDGTVEGVVLGQNCSGKWFIDYF